MNSCQKIFALIDCNAFYVSCERVFNPTLSGRPVVVLSNNDGCVIARSKEAKEIGIPMATPLFKVKDLVKRFNVSLCSSNYTLYQDMSNRVMSVLQELGFPMEIYSIDEAFLEISHKMDLLTWGKEIKRLVYRKTGIPISIGFGKTKTLAKLANHLAKTSKKSNGVCDLSAVSDEVIFKVLQSIFIGDVWGFGRRIQKKLSTFGIINPAQLITLSDQQIRSMLSVVGLKTVHELKGISCLSLEEEAPLKQNLCVSRSFPRGIDNKMEVIAALSNHIAKGCEKLRHQNLAASAYGIFIMTNRFDKNSYYKNMAFNEGISSTNDTRFFIKRLEQDLQSIWREGLKYTKAGIIFYDLKEFNREPKDLFDDQNQKEKSQKLMKAFDSLNQQYGERTLYFISQKSKENAWQMKADHKSPNYTTRFSDLPKVY